MSRQSVKSTWAKKGLSVILALVLTISFVSFTEILRGAGVAEATGAPAGALDVESQYNEGADQPNPESGGAHGSSESVPDEGEAQDPESESESSESPIGDDEPADSTDGASANAVVEDDSAEDEPVGDGISLLDANVGTLGELKSAIAAAADGDTITLTANITVNSQIYLGSSPGKNIVIDGGGFSLERASSYNGYLVRIQGGNGITFTNVTFEGHSFANMRAFVYLVDGNLTLGSGAVMQNSLSQGSGGAVNMIGGTMRVASGAVLQNNEAASNGGAATVAGGSVILEAGSIVQNNSAVGDGGGISVYSAGGNATSFVMEPGAVVSDNRAANGGGVSVRLVTAADTISAAGTFRNNNATGNGGGLYLNSRSAVTPPISVEGATFASNRAGSSGGGLALTSSNPSDSLTLSSVTVTDNAAQTGAGVFVYQRDTPTMFNLLIDNSHIMSNTADNLGGGVYVAVDAGLDATVSASNISSNTSATQGGGLWAIARGGDSGKLTISNGSSLEGNASTNGGGVYYRAAANHNALEVSGSNIFSNTATTAGGGLYLLGSTTPIQAHVENSSLSMNRQTDSGSAGGAAMYLSAVDLVLGDGSSVSGNTANMRAAGIMGARSSVTMEHGSQVSNNVAGHNGGGYYLQSDSSLVAKAGSSISGNSGINGGGVYASAILVDIAGSVTGNTASSRGGGIHVTNVGELVLREGSTVEDNTAGAGGGVALTGYSSGTIAGSISSNRTHGNGGGIFFGWPWNYVPSPMPATIQLDIAATASITNNEAALGGGLYATGANNNAATDVRVNVDGAAIEENTASQNGGGVYVETATLDMNAGTIADNTSGANLGHDLWVDPNLPAGSTPDGGVANLNVDETSFTDSADRDLVLIGAGTSGTINFSKSFAMKNHLLLQNSGADRSVAAIAPGATLTLSGKLTVGVADGSSSHALTVDPNGGSTVYKNDAEAFGQDPITGAAVSDMYALPGLGATVYAQWPEGVPDHASDAFKGWNDDGTMLPNRGVGYLTVAGDTTVTALWGTFNIQYFDEDGVTPITGLEPSSYAYGPDTTVLPQPSKEGYTFEAWYESADHSGNPVSSFANADQADKAYYAAWSKNPDPTPSPTPLPGPSNGAAGLPAAGDVLAWALPIGIAALLAAAGVLLVRRRRA